MGWFSWVFGASPAVAAVRGLGWFSWFFGASLAVAAIVTLIIQLPTKWAVLRRIRGWPGVQATLDTVGRLWASWEFRRLPTIPADRRPQQLPPNRPLRRTIGRSAGPMTVAWSLAWALLGTLGIVAAWVWQESIWLMIIVAVAWTVLGVLLAFVREARAAPNGR
jgi:hypothetical protein